MAEIKLSPPVIASKLPAFAGNTMRIPFTISKAVVVSDFNRVSVKIKSVQTNVEKMVHVTPNYYYDNATKNYIILCDIDAYNNSQTDGKKKFYPQIGQYYKVQVALVGEDTGYYSTLGVIKCTAEPQVIIKDRVDENGEAIKFHNYKYTGLYSQVNGDASEKVYSYCFNLYDEKNIKVATSGELIHNSSNDPHDQSTDTWTVRKSLDPNVNYEIEYIVTTINGLTRESGRYQIIECETKIPNVHAKLSAINHYDDGYISLKLIGDKSGATVNGRFILMRCSSEDNYDSWYELTKFDLSQYNSMNNMVICKDYTIQQGISYRYAIRAYTPQGLFSDRMMNYEGPVLCDFEDAFLFDGKRQLKIRFNPKVTGFKSTILETKTNTIGGKYPFIFRNGNVEYKEFSISGLISLLGDENNEFLTGLPAAADDMLSEFGHWLTADNIRKERQFKLQVLSWLTNGEPKIFRSPGEGNYIVRLMNTSLTPNDQMGRMLHTFSTQATEIAEYNFDNLKDYSFALNDYTETRSLKINQVTSYRPTYATNLGVSNPYPIGTEIVPPQPAVYVSVSGEPNTKFSYLLDGMSNPQYAFIGLTGTYNFFEGVLASTPLLKITFLDEDTNKNYNSMTVTYGYYDNTAYSFSIIDSIRISDKIVQTLGQGMNYNLIEKFSDIRLSLGAFHYIKVQPREIVKIIQGGNNTYYKDNGRDIVSALNKNQLYFIYRDRVSENNFTGYYFDGQDGSIFNATQKEVINLDYNFRINGMSEGQVIDFKGNYKPENNQLPTSGRYEALTNMSSITEIYAGDALILDMIYQEKEYTYVVEVDGEYYEIQVVSAKLNWKQELEKYQNMLSDPSATPEAITAQKNKVDTAYTSYLYWLEYYLNNLKEEFGVEYAI